MLPSALMPCWGSLFYALFLVFIRSLFIANATPILLEYWPFVIIYIFGVAPSICTTSPLVILASCTAMTVILFILTILAIFGHF